MTRRGEAARLGPARAAAFVPGPLACPWHLGLAAIVLLSGMVGAASPALAAEPPVKQSLRPVDAGGLLRPHAAAGRDAHPGCQAREAIGAASHKVVSGKSTIDVAVENTGNVRLKPVANFVLRDASGTEVSRAQVQMDTFYAHTATLVEVPLAALLQPGHYTVSLVLDDAAASVHAENDAIPLEVVEPPPPPAAENPAIPAGLTAVIQAVRDGNLPLVVGLGIIVAALLVGVLVGLLILALVRRRHRAAARRSGTPDGKSER